MALYKKRYRIEPARLQNWDYRSAACYFITINTANHRRYFGHITDGQMHYTATGEIAHRYLVEIPRHFPNVAIDTLQIMPDHLHAIIVITGTSGCCEDSICRCGAGESIDSGGMSGISPRSGSLSTIIRSYKAAVTKWCRRNRIHDFRWKERFYDHIIRDGRALENIRRYIRNNPANWRH